MRALRFVGVVLVCLLLGGFLTPATGARAAAGWTPGAAMGAARVYHTATLLRDGTVLIAGGYTTPWAALATAERYDPATGVWSPVAPMHFGRLRHAAAPLPDGRVLVVGGQVYPDDGYATAEIYDPATNTWTLVAPMVGPREWPTATTLRDGRVLVVDGSSSTPRQRSSGTAELYDPATNRWTPAGTLATERFAHSATLLPDGGVLVVGGQVPSHSPRCGSSRAICSTATAERYDPATNTWVAVASAASQHGLGHSATLLPDGQLLVVGGFHSEQTAERYDPRADRWSAARTPPVAQFATQEHTATLLADGLVLVAGGGQVPPTASTSLYDPASDTWRDGPTLATGRNRHTATRLRDGRVLVAGGGASGMNVSFNSTELYASDAPTVCFTETGFCIQGRFLPYWQANGGLARNGYPLTPERREVLEDGREYVVQYFERVRLELHPENPAPYDVLLGQFGRRILNGEFGAPRLPEETAPGRVYVAETGHTLGGRFGDYWRANGGLAQFGFPLTEEFAQRLEDGREYNVQYFERARFEYHPENAGTPYEVLLGQFGRRILAENDLLGTTSGSGFGLLYISNENIRRNLNAPAEQAARTSGTAQAFERGHMYYRSDTRRIYVFCGGITGIVLLAPGGETSFLDTWAEGQDPGGGPAPQSGLFYPQRGFGKLWRENQRVRDCLGYARSGTEEGYTFVAQQFRRGMMLSAPPSEGRTIYVVTLGSFGNGTGPDATYAPYPDPST